MAFLTFDDLHYERVRDIKRRIEGNYIGRHGVLGVGIARKEVKGRQTGELAIVFYVEHKRDVPQDQALPGSIEGIPTDVVPFPADDVAIDAELGEDKTRYDPLVGGCTIASTTKLATGGIVLPEKAGNMLLTAGHFVRNNQVDGQPFRCVQPVAGDYIGMSGASVYAPQRVRDRDVFADGGLIGCEAMDRGYAPLSIVEIGAIAGAAKITNSLVGAKCRKRGAVTTPTSGTIKDIDASFDQKPNCIVIQSDSQGPVGGPGDSGAVVVVTDKDAKQYIVGLIQGEVLKEALQARVSAIDAINAGLALGLTFFDVTPVKSDA